MDGDSKTVKAISCPLKVGLAYRVEKDASMPVLWRMVESDC